MNVKWSYWDEIDHLIDRYLLSLFSCLIKWLIWSRHIFKKKLAIIQPENVALMSLLSSMLMFKIISPGCCVGIRLNEADSLFSSSGEALSFRNKPRVCEKILHSDAGRQRYSCFCAGKHDKRKSSRAGIPS